MSYEVTVWPVRPKRPGVGMLAASKPAKRQAEEEALLPYCVSSLSSTLAKKVVDWVAVAAWF